MFQVKNKDGLWIRLSPANVEIYCEAQTESWALACSASGTLYINKKGEELFEAKSKPKSKGAASGFSFGAPAEDSSEPAKPAFGFGGPSLFGGNPQAPVGLFGEAQGGGGLFGGGGNAKAAGGLFGGGNAGGGLFGGGNAQGGLFGAGNAQAGGGLFGAAQPAGNFGFGAAPAPFNSGPNLFGGGAQPGLFGAPAAGDGGIFKSGFGAAVKADEPQNDGDTDAEEEVAAENAEKDADDSLADDSRAPPKKRKALGSRMSKKDSAPAAGKKSAPAGASHKAAPKAQSQGPLSPAVAECLRSVLCAFMWHESLVHDAMACALFLKFHPELSADSEIVHASESPDKVTDGGDAAANAARPTSPEAKDSVSDQPSKTSTPSKSPAIPTTLRYLLRIYQQLSSTMLQSLQKPLSKKMPTPASVKRVLANAEKEKRKVKREEKKQQAGAADPGGVGDLCDLCDKRFPSPVTYHMKQSHPGCGGAAHGMGYNSQGRYYGGWAGDCGDGGSGGSQWYLMCEACRARYMHEKKHASAEKVEKKVKEKSLFASLEHLTKGSAREVTSAAPYEVFTENARFLMMLAPSRTRSSRERCDSAGSELASIGQKDRQFEFLRLHSEPASGMNVIPSPSGRAPGHLLRSLSIEPPAEGKQDVMRARVPSVGEALRPRPGFLRSVSMHTPSASETSQEEVDAPFSLLQKPSHQLSKLVSQASLGGNGDAVGGNCVLRFVTERHDLRSLRWAMLRATQLSACRKHALEVSALGKNCSASFRLSLFFVCLMLTFFFPFISMA